MYAERILNWLGLSTAAGLDRMMFEMDRDEAYAIERDEAMMGRVKALEGQAKVLKKKGPDRLDNRMGCLDEKMKDLWKRQKYLGERAGRDDELLTNLKSKAADQQTRLANHGKLLDRLLTQLGK